MAEDTDVMFRIGVMDHPQSKAALESLAKSVEGAQAKMTAGVEAIGQAASRVGSLVDSLSSKLDELQSKQSSAMRGAVPDSVQPMGPPRSTSPQSSAPQFDGAEKAASDAADRIQSRFNGIDFSDMSKSMQNVFASLGSSAGNAADEIVEQMERSIAGLVQSPTAQAEVVKLHYQAMQVEASEAFVSMTADLDGYTAKHGSTMDQIGANLRRGEANIQKYRDSAGKMAVEARTSFIEGATQVATMVKGLATIGIVSEENAEKFLKSYAVIQGSFEVLAGGARAYNSFARGIIQAREAQQMLSKATTVATAVDTVQLAQVRAYHASLVQETVAANSAAAANGRLAASRAAAGAAATAGAAGSAASGIVEGLGGMGGLGRMARFGGMAGRVGGMALRASPVVAGAVALGTIGYQNATGASSNSDSSVMASVMKTNAWMLRLTGQFEKLDSPANKLIDSVTGFIGGLINVTGALDLAQVPGGASPSLLLDARGLAASQAGVERGQKSLDQNRITNDGNREIATARLEAEREKARLGFGTMIDSTRSRAEAETQRFGFRDLAGDREAERTNMFNRHKMRSVKDEGALGAATVLELGGNAARMRARPQEADSQLKAEMQLYPKAVAEYAKAKSDLDKTLSFAGSTEADRENAMKNATFYQDKMLDSMNRQAQLARASGAERLGIEREIQSAALAAIDQQQSKLDALNDRRKSAMRSFVDMDAIERSMATKALDKARAGGGGSLSKMETDLLGRIGTAETEQFVEQSTAAKAKQYGFDATFGQSMDMERRQIQGTRQQLEAQLQASFDVSMQVEANTDAVVSAITPYFDKAISDMTAAIEKSIDEKTNDKVAMLRLEMARNNAQLRKN